MSASHDVDVTGVFMFLFVSQLFLGVAVAACVVEPEKFATNGAVILVFAFINLLLITSLCMERVIFDDAEEWRGRRVVTVAAERAV